MRHICSVVASIGGLIGALFVFAALSGGGSSAIQEAAFAAVGVGFAVIPYLHHSIHSTVDGKHGHICPSTDFKEALSKSEEI